MRIIVKRGEVSGNALFFACNIQFHSTFSCCFFLLLVAAIIVDERVSQWIRIDSCYSADMICGYMVTITPSHRYVRTLASNTYHIHTLSKTKGQKTLRTCDASQFTYQFHSMHRFLFQWNILPSLGFPSCCVKPFNASYSYLYQVLRIKMAPFDLIHECKIKMKFSKAKINYKMKCLNHDISYLMALLYQSSNWNFLV